MIHQNFIDIDSMIIKAMINFADSQQNYASLGVQKTESLNVQLEVPPGQTSGLVVHEESAMLVVSHVAAQSPAFRSVTSLIS